MGDSLVAAVERKAHRKAPFDEHFVAAATAPLVCALARGQATKGAPYW